jgi:hypothetical protein
MACCRSTVCVAGPVVPLRALHSLLPL